ncbi:MAG: type IV pilus twitching motility protein PilT [Candidatus Daviesbacteria bacterium]|nr:type IV pilus twitching motility protein PilT [Candidatus Daviesbacteria bacterium]
MNINQLLQLTIQRNASDLHLVPGYPPLLRLNGELVPVSGPELVTDEVITAFTITILNPLQKKIFDENLEVDLSFTFAGRSRFRVNVFKEQGHIAVALRHIPELIPELTGLGLPPVIQKLSELKQGLILITGPTGHGKTTTLAALLNKINLTRSCHIITIEDPVEYVYPKGKALINQREMFSDTKSWNGALRAVLREDPDVVLVGEMRDFETISAAVTVAETGHLVFATLHTNSASQSVDRIIDAFPTHQQSQIRTQLSSALEAIISQRLVPTINPGRALAVEVLIKTPALSTLIRDGKSHLIDNLIQTSGELGMVSLDTSLAKLISDGKISKEMGLTFSLHPDFLARLI